jgi:hypothetical protein
MTSKERAALATTRTDSLRSKQLKLQVTIWPIDETELALEQYVIIMSIAL